MSVINRITVGKGYFSFLSLYYTMIVLLFADNIMIQCLHMLAMITTLSLVIWILSRVQLSDLRTVPLLHGISFRASRLSSGRYFLQIFLMEDHCNSVVSQDGYIDLTTGHEGSSVNTIIYINIFYIIIYFFIIYIYFFFAMRIHFLYSLVK